MKILYDHQSFTGMTYGGVTRYFHELMQSFSQRNDVDVELSLKLSNNEYLASAPFANYWRFKRWSSTPTIVRAASLINRLYSMKRIGAGNFDVFHPTYYHPYFLPFLGRKPFVVTFHDATSERFGQAYPELGEGLFAMKQTLLRRADAVIAVSEFSRQELLTFFDVDPAKIQVIPLGTSFSSWANPPATTPLPFPYLLFVGKREFYKNFAFFFQAVQPLLHRYPDLHLVCAGGGSFTRAEQQKIQQSNLGGRVHQLPINDALLFGLYQHARLFVFPSLNEGFGIPVLEAFSAGCPAALSNRSSLPEVGGDAALYFDPQDAEAMAHVVDQLISNDSLRQQLLQKGRERITQFSCEKTAQLTLDVYKQIA